LCSSLHTGGCIGAYQRENYDNRLHNIFSGDAWKSSLTALKRFFCQLSRVGDADIQQTNDMQPGALAGTMILAENIDGESILALLQHFSGRQEDRKIMIVLSDGSPAAQGRGLTGHLKMVTKQIEQDTDIHLLGIGILTDAPRHFYRDNICLNNVGDLARNAHQANATPTFVAVFWARMISKYLFPCLLYKYH
jgi:hypothetical protein